MSTPKHHVFTSRDLVDSVIHGREVKALCGYSKTFTRSDFDPKGDATKRCKKCFVGIPVDGDRLATVHAPQTWLETLERVYREATTVPQWRYQIRFDRGFPLAG